MCFLEPTEVETFLSVTLKDVKLPQTALNEKTCILQKIDKLQENFPQLKVDLTQTESGKSSIQTTNKTNNSLRIKGLELFFNFIAMKNLSLLTVSKSD